MKPNTPTVTIIPATIDHKTMNPLGVVKKRRTAAYARVSTDSEEQKESFDAQVSYYTEYIKSKPEWEFVKVYTDEAITATNTKKRDGFNDMVKDALDGKIDLIITKSVSRFARNTVDTLSNVRQLKEKGIEVYFEKENINTLDSKGELLITIMSSLAQEESRSISENVTWGQRKRMADGKVNMPYGRFLGYEKGEDGNPKIVESEAKTVRKIYALFLDGETYRSIAELLTGEGITTPGGLAKWGVSTVRSILQNEKYAGNAILQKKFTVDFLTKKTKANEGEVPQYYVENSHPAIVPETTYNLVQAEMRRRATLGKQLSGSGLFFGKIICGQCGSFYGTKVWHSNSQYRRIVWQCNNKYSSSKQQKLDCSDQHKNKTKCMTPHISGDDVKSSFVAVFQQLIGDKSKYVRMIKKEIESLIDTMPFDEQTARLRIECAKVFAEVDDWIALNARTIQDQKVYQKRYVELVAKYDQAKHQLKTLEKEKKERAAKKENLQRFLKVLEQTNTAINDFNESLWRATVESVTIYPKTDLLFTFRGGIKVWLTQTAKQG